MKNRSLSDILLFPKSLFEKITDKRATLYLGILLVGVVDIIFPSIVENYTSLFAGKSPGELTSKIILIAISIVLIGLIDVLFFSFPLFDLFKLLRKDRPEAGKGSQLVKVMKVYILAHFLVLFIEGLNYTVFRGVTFEANPTMYSILAYLSLIFVIWFYAVISRGINIIYNFTSVYRTIVLVSIVGWSFLLGIALDYIVMHWVIPWIL